MGFVWSCYLGSQLKIRSCFLWNSCGCDRRCTKLSLPLHAAPLQGVLNRMNDCLAYCGRIAKAHFAFCRVNVYVHRRGIDLEKKKRYRKLTFHQSGMIALADSCRE